MGALLFKTKISSLKETGKGKTEGVRTPPRHGKRNRKEKGK